MASKAEAKNPADEVGADQVKQAFDEAAEKGYFGWSPDDTPRENYSLQTPQDAYVPEVDDRIAAAEESNKRKVEARKSR